MLDCFIVAEKEISSVFKRSRIRSRLANTFRDELMLFQNPTLLVELTAPGASSSNDFPNIIISLLSTRK